MDEGEAEFYVLHLLLGIFPVPGVERHRAALGVRHQERKLTRADDRDTAELITGSYIGDVGDAVARHVVMVKSLPELLGREDLVLDGAAGIPFHRGAPVLQRLLQR